MPKPLTPTEHQRRWRAKKRNAEIAAGLRPARKKRPLTAAQRQSRWRAKKAAAEKERKYAASRERRRLSRSAPQIEPEFRLGDCREVLSDIAADSVALVLTDPPWGNEAKCGVTAGLLISRPACSYPVAASSVSSAASLAGVKWQTGLASDFRISRCSRCL